MGSPKSCLSWGDSSEENVLVGTPNPWFDYYQYVPPSPTISVETDPNWGRECDTEDEEINALFDLQIDLQDLLIENPFSSSDEEPLDDDDLKLDFDDVHGPFSRMWIFVISLSCDDFVFV